MSLPDLARYDTVTVDTETTGTSAKDRAVGMSIWLPDETGHYIRWGHEDGGNNCSRSEYVAWAQRELAGKELVFFNAPFDTRMMAYDNVMPICDVADADRLHDAGIQAPLYNELEYSFKLDRLAEKHIGERKLDDTELNEWCASHFGGKASHRQQIGNYWRAPGGMVEPYAIHDARITRRLFEFYRPKITDQSLDVIYDVERHILPMLLKMHLTGVRVDVDRARTLKQELIDKWQGLEEKWCRQSGEEKFIDSGKRFAPVFERLKLPVQKTPKGNPTFAKEVLATYDHPIAQLIRDLRKLKHYSGTFIENYILQNVDLHWLVHGEFHSVRNDRYGTVSGRFSSGGELNLQNIPKRDKFWGPLIRGLYVPLPGYRWGKIDYSQIEYRFFAHYCGGRMVQMYVDDPYIDFHQKMAELTGHERSHAKNINFAALYGAGIGQIAIMMGCDLETAREVYDEYHLRVPEVQDLTDKVVRTAAKRGHIHSWGGRRHRFPKKSRDHHAEARKALNRLCQGSAADLIKYAMRGVDQVIDWEHVICHLTVHDELDFSVSPCSTGQKMFREVKEVMEDADSMGGPQRMTVPVIADAEIGDDWGHVEAFELEAA